MNKIHRYNQFTFSQFRRNGTDASLSVPLRVTVRGRVRFHARPFYYITDKELELKPWSIVTHWSVNNWRDYFDEYNAGLAVSLDGSPAFVVERWIEE